MSDYISREELLEKERYCDDFNLDLSYVDIEDVKSISSADVRENIHGEWIPKERTTECSVDIDIVCSECGYVGIEGYAHGYELNEINIQEVRDYTKKLDMNFCTCCGAKMRGGEWMKLIIDISEDVYAECQGHIYFPDTGGELFNAVKNGTPFDSVIEDIKAEVFRQSEQNNENFTHDWNEGFNDGMFHTLTIIRECIKHISGKASE